MNGSTADWVSAAASVITALIALGGVVYGVVNVRAIRRERDVAQAARVYVVRATERADAPGFLDEPRDEGPDDEDDVFHERLSVLNNAEEPVFDLALAVTMGARRFDATSAFLEPGATWSAGFTRFESEPLGEAVLTFTDSFGTVWTREESGSLSGVRSSHPVIRIARG